MRYEYPGNVRELENIIERAFILCKGGMIDLRCLPPEIVPSGELMSSDPSSDENILQAAESKSILQTLALYDGHRVKTAKALGIHKTTLLRKMKKLGITYP
jgi:DNA-binding NtrC family response regulator